MVKIVIIGAGSAVFSKNVIADILWHESLKDCELVLVDIDKERLDTVYGLALSLRNALQAQAKITAAVDRRAALPGADFVICTIGVGGAAAIQTDLDLPLQAGLRQTVGDTLGVGGIFRAARSIPEVLAICHDMEELCPGALLMNYANPMAMHCLAIHRASTIRVVGLCHGVVNTARTLRMLTEMADVPDAEISRHFARAWNDPIRVREWAEWQAKGDDPHLAYTCAGINHMAFFLQFTSQGEDLYPKLRKVLAIPHLRRLDPVRLELYEWLGYFMTETSGHTAEYTPYYLKSEQEITRQEIRVGHYLGTYAEQETEYRQLRDDLHAGRRILDMPYRLSVEYASRIINAVVTDHPFVFNGNVANRQGALIANLPGDCCVEVPCEANGQGIRPSAIGELPPQCAALIQTNVNVQDLTVRGILERRREYIYQALMLDPNTAATLTLPQITQPGNIMFAAHADRLLF